ncbi:transmembrane alpha-helix domain-containing protein [Pochonia chlamydosporia 170]|uniref:Transmembrane alpha-helix domain-containing protein n=1 Tax=Pochonia chlamydosporia 170 TaxID=1380566 RepID=A0A179FVN4_METCM|nr:transmembrane alpha-helix domain-containing protein [Pochonia chlamydosporia 170]OAQ69715.1 transmembrane alpha-helix domain-containing protein [Pochonia chlamydosporia 170]
MNLLPLTIHEVTRVLTKYPEDEEKKRFPRVTACNDGSFCCEKDGTGCCTAKKGTFLDKNGNIAKGPATTTLSWGPERTSAGYQTVTSAQTTISTATNTPTQSPSATPSPDSNDDNNAAKIGAGVGVPVGVLAIGGVAAFFFFRRRKQAKNSNSVPELGTEGEQKKVVYTGPPVQPQELDGSENQVHRSELPA